MRIKPFIFFWLLVIPAILAGQGRLRVQSFSAQGVHISGEDVWFSIVTSGSATDGIMNVRLLDRKGKILSSTRMRIGQGMLSGYLPTATALPSDYYFIDAVMEGISCETRPAAVMIVNPAIPPAPNCNPVIPAAPAAGNSMALDKKDYKPREEVKLDLGTQGMEELVVTVAQHDALSELLDSASAGFEHVIRHEASSSGSLDGQVFTVRATRQGQPASGIDVLAGVRGQQTVLARGTTDADGRATLVFPQLNGLVRIFATVADGSAAGVTLQWEEEPSASADIPFPCLRLGEYHRAGLEQRLFNARITAGFLGEQTKAFDVAEKDTTDFYGKPDQRYWLDSYVRFPVMEEVILEIMPPVKFRKQGDEQYLQVLNLPLKTFFETPALVMVDGLPVPNDKKLLDLDPITVRCVDVMTRKYILGSREFSGIVHFKTYRGNGQTAGIERLWQGLQDGVQYQGVSATGSQQSLPQMRNLVFHEMRTRGESKDLSFTLPDGEGTYQLRMLGLRNGGPTVNSALLQVSR